MDNEVSTSLSVTIQIMIVAVVVGMLSIFTALGQGFGRDAATSVAETQALSYASELRALADHGPVPVASLLVVLQKNEDAVRNIGGFAYGVAIAKAEDLTAFALLSKKVRIALTPISDRFDLIVSPE
jgi:hypothetical protein